MTNKHTSALTITIAGHYSFRNSLTCVGNAKHVLTIMISVMIFQNPMTQLNVLGTAITVIGAAMYSYVDEYKSRIQAATSEVGKST